jgi:hypothetical protein
MLRVRLSFGAYAGPRWLHWLAWLWSWSFWIAFGTNSDKSHGSARFTQAQILAELGAKAFRVIIDCLSKLYPKLAAEIKGGCDLVIDSTIFPGSDCAGNLVKRGTAIRPIGYQKNKREEMINFSCVPDSCIRGFLRRCGKGYWWWGLFRLLIPKWLRPKPPADWREDDSFCDELIFVVAEEYGKPLVHPSCSPCDALPEYLALSPFGEHEGDMESGGPE